MTHQRKFVYPLLRNLPPSFATKNILRKGTKCNQLCSKRVHLILFFPSHIPNTKTYTITIKKRIIILVTLTKERHPGIKRFSLEFIWFFKRKKNKIKRKSDKRISETIKDKLFDGSRP